MGTVATHLDSQNVDEHDRKSWLLERTFSRLMMAARLGFGSPGGNYFSHFAKGFSSWESSSGSTRRRYSPSLLVENCRAIFRLTGKDHSPLRPVV